MQKTYKLSKKQTIILSLAFGSLIVLPLLFISISVVMPNSAEQSMETFNLFLILSLLLYISVTGVFYWYFRRIEMSIDQKGIRTNSKLLNQLPNFSEISFHHNVKANFIADSPQTIGSHFSILKRFDAAIIIRDSHSGKQFIISNEQWDIDAISSIKEQLTQLGIELQPITIEKFIEKNLPQLAPLDKKATVFSYTTILFLCASIIIPLLDKWSTIYYGAFKYSLWGSFLFASLIAFVIMSRDIRTNYSHKIVALLFGLSFTALYFSLFICLTPMLGTHAQLTFTYHKTNEYNEESWVADDNANLKIFCTASNHRTPQVATISSLTSVIRVSTEELCPHAEYLSDAMLPHD